MIISTLRVRFALASLAVLFTLAVITPSPALAITTYIAESYTAEEALPMNSIVSLKSNSNDSVVAANTSNVDTMIGVTIDRNDASITVTNGKENQVQVAKSGTLQVLVSDINGAVEQGDYITASPINGVGMRATGSTKVIGIAQNGLTGGVAQTIKNSDGTEQSVKVGTVPVLVSVSGYIEKSENSFIPRPVQEIANTLAGRTVSPLPILLSLGVFLVTLIVVTIIIYSMVRNGIISVGRNPLSSSAIYRNVIQLSVLVLGILVGAGVIIYFILTRM
ncbi:MAG: hypothetical protein ACO1N2_03385 [Candidatus Saccharimonadota bacterium]|jgi:hypothetical protein